jgi:hypothetical protein
MTGKNIFTKGNNMDIPAVLTHLYPGAIWSLNGDLYSGLDWLDDSPKPTESELEAAWPTVQAERYNAQARASRHAAFVAEADPLFMKWQAGEGTESEWLAAREDVRDRFPYVEVP